jgi:4-hydroxy-tetrahydrodipicolinate synthase
VPEAIVALAEGGRNDPNVVELVREITRHPVAPMVKALVAHIRRDPAWAVARPPLPTIDGETAARVARLLEPFGLPPKAVA